LLVDLRLYLLPVISIVLSQGPGILLKLAIYVSYVTVYLGLVVVVLFAVLCPQLGAVTGNQLSSDQIKMFRNPNGCPEDFLYGL
jgi:hypothetical protein